MQDGEREQEEQQEEETQQPAGDGEPLREGEVGAGDALDERERAPLPGDGESGDGEPGDGGDGAATA